MSDLRRELSPSELFCHHYMKRDSLYPVQYIKISGKLPLEVFRNALLLLITKYQVLQSKICQIDRKLHYKISKNAHEEYLDKNFIIKKQISSDYWKHVMIKEMDIGPQAFYSTDDSDSITGLLTRTIVLISSDEMVSEIIFGYHHSVADGQSCVVWLNDLFEYAKSLQEKSIIPEITDPIKIDDSVKIPIRNSFERIDLCDPSFNIDKKPKITHKNIYVTLENPSKLLGACKRNGVTFNVALSTAMIFALESIVFTQQGELFQLLNAVSVRRYYNVDPKAIGYFASATSKLVKIGSPHDPSNTEKFWKSAQDYKMEMDLQIDGGKGLQAMDPSILDTMDDKIYDSYPFGKVSMAMISNRGVIDQFFKRKYGEIKIEEMFHSVTAPKAPAMMIVLCNTLEGKISLTFSCTSPFTSEDTLQKVANYVINTLACLE